MAGGTWRRPIGAPPPAPPGRPRRPKIHPWRSDQTSLWTGAATLYLPRSSWASRRASHSHWAESKISISGFVYGNFWNCVWSILASVSSSTGDSSHADSVKSLSKFCTSRLEVWLGRGGGVNWCGRDQTLAACVEPTGGALTYRSVAHSPLPVRTVAARAAPRWRTSRSSRRRAGRRCRPPCRWPFPSVWWARARAAKVGGRGRVGVRGEPG